MRSKRILFSCYGLGIGGIERCLVNLLNVLAEQNFELDLLLMNPEYDLKEQLSTKVKLLEAEKYVFNSEDTWNIKQEEKNRILSYYFFRILNKLQHKPWSIFKPIRKKYDVAIAYSQNDFSPYYIMDKVYADKKILWYHNGVYEKSGKQYRLDQQYYTKFDNIVTVSQDAKKMLQHYFPDLRNKILILPNIMDISRVKAKAEEKIKKQVLSDKFTIMTVGRLTKEKGADLAVEACYKLVKAGYDICWYWIGDGNQREIIEGEIRKNRLEENFILLGNQNNPYKYMKRCDLYVQPSYYEAYCTTTNEARVLGKVIVATDVGGMREQIRDGVTGFIVDINSESIFNRIKELVEKPQLREKIETNVKKSCCQFGDYIKEYIQLFR